jgi:hypothetical protein
MIIWLSMAVPLVFAAAMLIYFRRNCTWWEYLIPCVVSFVLIVICRMAIESLQTRDSEYWGAYVEYARYYEKWDEEVPCTHAVYRTEIRTRTTTDSKGRTTTYTYPVQVFDHWMHPYDVDNHPPYWVYVDNCDGSTHVSQGDWQYCKRIWKNSTFVDMKRDYHSIDGDAYDVVWNNKFDDLIPIATQHTYENRVQASDSIFKYPNVPLQRQKALYDYPRLKDPFNYTSVLAKRKFGGEDSLRKLNGYFGKDKQIRVWLLVYENQPMSVSKNQEAYWQGGNKNEFVICVSVDKEKNIQWANVFSWTKRNDIKIETRDYLVNSKKLDIKALAEWLMPVINSKWERRHFKEFNYLNVEPPTWAVFLTFVLTIAANVGVCYWAVKNEYKEN